MKNFNPIYLILFLVSSLVFAGVDPSNKLKLGDGAASNKIIEFNKGSGTANPKLRWNNSSTTLQFSNDGTTFSDLGSGSSTQADSSVDAQNIGFTVSMSANAATIALKTKALADPSSSDKVNIGFRSSTLTSGTYNLRTVTSALSITIPSTATLGSFNGVAQYVYIYAIDNAGTVELAVSASNAFDESLLVTTSTITPPASTVTTMYSTTGRTSVPVRLIGRFKSTQATAGTWVTAASEVSTYERKQPAVTSNLSTQESIQRAYITNTASNCAISRQSGTWIASISTPATGQCTMTLSSGIFATAPTCVATPNDNGTSLPYAMKFVSDPTTTTVDALGFQTTTGTPVSTTFQLICIGPKGAQP